MVDSPRPYGFRYCLIVLLLLLVAGIVGHRFDLFAGNRMYRHFAHRVKDFLIKGMVHEHPIPFEKGGHPPDPAAFAYILGGDQESLHYKFRTVGRLYKEGLVRKILVLRSPGITEYSPFLGRNLTNDEWMFMELGKEGVAGDDVELIYVPPSFFGTFGEAQTVSHLAGLRGVRRLVLVSARHHMERVWLAFSYFKGANPLELYTYGSKEEAGIYELLAEYIKLTFYRYFLLPAERQFRSFSEIPDDPRTRIRRSSGLMKRSSIQENLPSRRPKHSGTQLVIAPIAGSFFSQP